MARLERTKEVSHDRSMVIEPAQPIVQHARLGPRTPPPSLDYSISQPSKWPDAGHGGRGGGRGGPVGLSCSAIGR